MASVNRNGYLVVSRLTIEAKTYACTDDKGVEDLICHLTNRTVETFLLDHRGFPIVYGISISEGLHIYSGNDSEQV